MLYFFTSFANWLSFLFLSLAMARSLNFFVLGESRPSCASYCLMAERLSISLCLLPSEVSLTGIYSSPIINFLSGILEGKRFASPLKSPSRILWSVMCLTGLLNSFSSESFLRFGESFYYYFLLDIYIGFKVIDGRSRILSFLGEIYDSKP